MEIIGFISCLSWMGVLKIITVITVISLTIYALIKFLNWQELKTLIPEVIKYIMEVEKESRDNYANGSLQLPMSSSIKLQTVVNRIEDSNQDITQAVKKSTFKKIGRFVQYVFTNFAEPIILRKYK